MTLPTGVISINDLRAETGSGGAFGLGWLGGNVKGFGGGYNLASVRGLTWYAKNNAYNCTLNSGGQCEPAFVSGVYNCAAVQGNPSSWGGGSTFGQCTFTNCDANAACNCACNCDNRAWLQSNCNCGANCNCAYNCNYNNCDCTPTVCSDCGGRC